MRKLILALAACLSIAPAYGQVPQTILPANSVLGRLGISAGPAQAIPFNILQEQITGGAACAVNTFGCFTFGSAPTLEAGFWPIAFFRIGADQTTTPGPTPNDGAYQFGFLTEISVPAFTSTPASTATITQKTAIEGLCSTNMIIPAVPPAPTAALWACVGVEGRGYIWTTNPLGTAWGMVSQAQIPTFGGTVHGDGYLVSLEADILNNGIDQPAIGQQTSKIGVQIVNQGPNPATTAIQIVGAGAPWHKGVFATTADLATPAGDAATSFLELCQSLCTTTTPFDIWRVRSDGAMIQTFPSSATVPMASFQGSASTSPSNPSVLFGVFPTPAGSANDAFSLEFWFTDFTAGTPPVGVKYQGANITALQLVPTHGNMTTGIAFATMINGGTLATAFNMSSVAFYPAVDGGATSGKPSSRWNQVMLFPQSVAAIGACGGTNEGALAFANNAVSTTPGTALTTGTSHALVVCANSQWTIVTGH